MTAGALDVADRFDAASAWAALSEPVRAAIGAAVLSRHVATLVIERAMADDDPVRERVGVAADTVAWRELDRALGTLTAHGRPPFDPGAGAVPP